MASPVQYGRPMREAHWGFAPDYLPLNHGCFGAHPNAVRDANSKIREECEAGPDAFIFYETPRRLLKARDITAKLLNASREEVVFVPNATTGIDTVLKNISWQKGDVILYYEVIYGSVSRGLSWLTEMHGVETEAVKLQWPASDDEVVRACGDAVRKINEEGKGQRRVRMAICDTIVSMPGFRIPFERLVEEFHKEGALVMLDGAHCAGQIDIDLNKIQPDFFVTNLHKWLYVPRGFAAFYVPLKNQHLIKTSLPTAKPLPSVGLSPFEDTFDFTGTNDITRYLTIEAALKFREEVCGGEEAIKSYCKNLARTAGDKIAKLFGTEVLDHPDSNMRDCAFAMIRLPLEMGDGPGQIRQKDAVDVVRFIHITTSSEYNTYLQCIPYHSNWWWRLSGQVYIDEEDCIKGAKILQEVCDRIKKGEHIRAR